MSKKSPALPDQSTHIWEAMQKFVSNEDRRREIRDAFDFGRGLGRIAVLLKLTESPMTLRDIAESQGVDAPYATVIVDKLESRGLVARTPHPEGNRRKLVTLTEAGWEAASMAREVIARPPASFSALSTEDLAALDRIVEKLLNSQHPDGVIN